MERHWRSSGATSYTAGRGLLQTPRCRIRLGLPMAVSANSPLSRSTTISAATTASNWSAGVPNAVDASANFGTVILASREITVDGPQTVGTLAFSSALSYNLIGSGTITLDVSTGQAAINVSAGNHTIAAPVLLNKDTTITTAASSSLLLT